MLTFEALRPLRLNTKTRGTLSLQPGERVTWPDEAVNQLLAKIPERIRLVPEAESRKLCPFNVGQTVAYQVPVIPTKPPEVRVTPVCHFRIGQRVTYKYPDNIRGAVSFDWAYSTGVVYAIDHHGEMVTLYPTDEAEPWRQVPWTYLTPEMEVSAHESTIF